MQESFLYGNFLLFISVISDISDENNDTNNSSCKISFVKIETYNTTVFYPNMITKFAAIIFVISEFRLLIRKKCIIQIRK